MAKIKAVIFDMDGVLINAKDWHYEALNKALSYFGMEIGRYEHLTTYDGHPTKTKLKMLTLDKGLPEGLHAFIYKLKQTYTVNEIYEHCKPVFAHQFLLSRLKKEGYKLAVCSNSIRPTIELMLEKAEISPFCEFFLSNQDVKNSKPHPEIYTTAISKLGFQPNECLIVEDNPVGLKAARESGAHVLEVKDVDDVTHDNISSYIKDIESGAQHG